MTRLDQATDARMREIRDMVRSGATEMTGKTRREYEGGKIVGRFGGGMSIMYPELKHAGSPAVVARAVERGRGKVYQRVRREVRRELSKYIRESRRHTERPVVPAHAAMTKKCKVCKVAHGKGQHRFHGEGSYHSTHLFSFGGNPVRKRKRARNPRKKKLVVIYGAVLSIDAQKTQAHQCDSTCTKFRHKYRHVFKSKPKMYGLPNGDILITTRHL